MRSLLLFSLLLLCFFGCNSGESGSEAAGDAATPFGAAAAALEAGESAAAVSKLLLDNFQLVSDQATGAINLEASAQFADLAGALAKKYPQDTMAALPLYKAAEVVRAMNNPVRAASFYEMTHRSFPGFSKAGEALFMLGFTYDEDLNDEAKARQYYEQFIREYPDHPFADDTQMLIDNLGKTDEEILRELEEKAKALEEQ
ncbi:tol-pal system YbgF family protein [Lewinella sp. W8]|uniref:tetratricopeptide repeat protein n=1 Tax=Lewinella sp. W8 TaxID=2528208 RepID=UPI001067E428|nr:tetratricopeptide repeat protein [Lewinella sp. W8]MTB50844.1 tetratricopeptide repeat protein [Lewinella sp. W8]